MNGIDYGALLAGDYHEQQQGKRGLRARDEREAQDDARELMKVASGEVAFWADTSGAQAARGVWNTLRAARRAADRPATDRLEWRGRCHRVNGLTEKVVWPGGKATRHTVHLRERARCLLMGRDYPIAGPSGRLP